MIDRDLRRVRGDRPSALGPGCRHRATRGGAPAASAETARRFRDVLAQMAADTAEHADRHGEATCARRHPGQASVQQVVEAVMSAEQTLQGAIAIRDKVVSAYLEIEPDADLREMLS